MNENRITEPLRLAVGSHKAGSGKGCAMNVISWENGDTTITDLPDCADQMLARIVQRVNDNICEHRDGDLLCPACSIEVLALAHRTVGTGLLPLTDVERQVVWVRVAVDQARAVLHLVVEPELHRLSLSAIEAAERWAADPSPAAAYATYAANAAANAAEAATYAAYAANAAANAAEAAAVRLELAHRAIDLFEQLTGHVAPAVPDRVVRDAYKAMVSS